MNIDPKLEKIFDKARSSIALTREDCAYLLSFDEKGYESALIRSKDLRCWEESPLNPVFAACEGEGINNSDVDLCEIDGKTVFCYAIGNQLGWVDVREAVYDGTCDEFFAECFPDKEPDGK